MSQKEKSKITAEDLMALPEPPVSLVAEQGGAYNFRYAESVDIVEQMRFVCLKYNQKAKEMGSDIRIIPLDFMVKDMKGNKILIIKKTGKLKIAKLEGYKNSIPKIVDRSPNNVLIEAKVFFEGNDTPFVDFGYCGKEEKGKDWWDFTTLLGTATTRAILRAISQHVIVDLMDEADYEQIAQNVENQIDAEDLRKVEKLTAMKEEEKDRKQTQAEEAALQSKEITAQRKFGNTKQTKKADKLINNILAHTDQPVNHTDPYEGVEQPEDV